MQEVFNQRMPEGKLSNFTILQQFKIVSDVHHRFTPLLKLIFLFFWSHSNER